MLDKAQKLRIIFLTDIHLSTKWIPKFVDWVNVYYNNEPKFDYCFIGGDTANCDHQKMSHSQEQMLKETIQVHLTVKQALGCKVFSIPGNHDCKCFFNPNYYPDGFYNIHNRKLQLANGLDLIGFGGAGPGFVDGQQVWSGYPYKNQKQVALQWTKNDILSDKLKIAQQIILLTHQGPQVSETSFDRSEYPTRSVAAGSTHLNKLYERKDIVGWFHGHTHQGSNYSKVSGIQVMNPGPLAFGRFMHFQLLKQNMRWKMGKKTFEVL